MTSRTTDYGENNVFPDNKMTSGDNIHFKCFHYKEVVIYDVLRIKNLSSIWVLVYGS